MADGDHRIVMVLGVLTVAVGCFVGIVRGVARDIDRDVPTVSIVRIMGLGGVCGRRTARGRSYGRGRVGGGYPGEARQRQRQRDERGQ